jgi:hypothetical protein
MSLGKPTEKTLQDLLREELVRRGVGASAQVSFQTVDGRRLEPDLVLRNGAQYVVEMKLGAETKLLDAMVQLYEYGKHVSDAKGAFAVLLPEELRKPWPADVVESLARDNKTRISCIGVFKDLRPSEPFKGSLFEVADWIAGHVLKPLVVEVDIAVLKILGYSEDEAKQLLDYLYPALVKEIEQLKTSMEG